MPETTSTSNSQIEAIAKRFWRLEPPERGAMVLSALGGQRRPDGWVMPNGRVFAHHFTAYQATDLNAVTGAEHAADLTARRLLAPTAEQPPTTNEGVIRHIGCRKGSLYSVEVSVPGLALAIRVEARRESTARALAVVLLASALRSRIENVRLHTSEPKSTHARRTSNAGNRRPTLTLSRPPA